MGRETDSWPAWDGRTSLQDRRIRLNYPNGLAYAVGNARQDGAFWYFIAGTAIYFTTTARVQVAPEGTR